MLQVCLFFISGSTLLYAVGNPKLHTMENGFRMLPMDFHWESSMGRAESWYHSHNISSWVHNTAVQKPTKYCLLVSCQPLPHNLHHATHFHGALQRTTKNNIKYTFALLCICFSIYLKIPCSVLKGKHPLQKVLRYIFSGRKLIGDQVMIQNRFSLAYFNYKMLQIATKWVTNGQCRAGPEGMRTALI